VNSNQIKYQIKGAADRLVLPVLREASGEMTEAGNRWRSFALDCAKAGKRRNGMIDLSEIALLRGICGETEKEVYLLFKRDLTIS